jgi:hypothetical protein
LLDLKFGENNNKFPISLIKVALAETLVEYLNGTGNIGGFTAENFTVC